MTQLSKSKMSEAEMENRNARASDHEMSHNSTLTPSSKSLGKKPVQSNEPICTKPFDQWRPVGGGAERNIFRCFKVLPSEEEAFLTFWASKRPANGYISHDDDGILVFRISSASLSELAALGISGTNPSSAPTSESQWVQVLDREGISWLTQRRCNDLDPSEFYDAAGQPLSRIGEYGPLGITVREYLDRES